MWQKILVLSIFGCQSILTDTLDLGGVVSGNRMAGVPLGLSLGSGELDIEGVCSSSGMACQNCSLAVTCVALPVGWLKVPLQHCEEGKTCNAHLGGCSVQTVPECEAAAQKYQHTCEQVGIFPDAHDCRKFHLCSPPDGELGGRPADHRAALCPHHYGYDPRTGQCSIKLPQGQCTEKPVPACKSVGQTGSLPTSPNHYFVCLIKDGELHPQIFLCPHGWYFWDRFCRPEEPPVIKENAKDKIQAVEDNKEINHSSEENKIENEKETKVIGIKRGKKEFNIEKKKEEFVSNIDHFFSTEKATTAVADTFLADKFDLANYDNPAESESPNYEFTNSFESEW